MLTRWSDFDRSLAMMDELRRTMDRLFDDPNAGYPRAPAAWPPATLEDKGSTLVFTAEVPGLSEKDLRLSVQQESLRLEGERQVVVPRGYAVHRQERAGVRFARSYALPCRVDAERTTAAVRDGVLTVTLPKAPEDRPRTITVQAS